MGKRYINLVKWLTSQRRDHDLCHVLLLFRIGETRWDLVKLKTMFEIVIYCVILHIVSLDTCDIFTHIVILYDFFMWLKGVCIYLYTHILCTTNELAFFNIHNLFKHVTRCWFPFWETILTINGHSSPCYGLHGWRGKDRENHLAPVDNGGLSQLS